MWCDNLTCLCLQCVAESVLHIEEIDTEVVTKWVEMFHVAGFFYYIGVTWQCHILNLLDHPKTHIIVCLFHHYYEHFFLIVGEKISCGFGFWGGDDAEDVVFPVSFCTDQPRILQTVLIWAPSWLL